MKHVKTGKELNKALDLGIDYLKKDIVIILSKTSMDAFYELLSKSAYKTGFLKSKWSVTTNNPPNDELKGNKNTMYIDAVYPVFKVKYNDIIHHYNNTEYAVYLENGTDNMSAQPMIKPTQIKVKNQLDKASKLLSKKYYNI